MTAPPEIRVTPAHADWKNDLRAGIPLNDDRAAGARAGMRVAVAEIDARVASLKQGRSNATKRAQILVLQAAAQAIHNMRDEVRSEDA